MTYTFHPRATWVDARHPVTGPPMPIKAIDTLAPHYTAAVNLIDGDVGEFVENLPAYIRAIHLDYLTHRPQPSGATGYSIGYNFAIDWLGGVWELRGFGIKCAANVDNNDHVIAVLFLVDGNDAPTELAMAAFRELNREARRRVGRKLIVIDHGRLPGAATACAGIGIRRVVDLGWLDDNYIPGVIPPESPAPTPAPTQGDNMIGILELADSDVVVIGEVTAAGSMLRGIWVDGSDPQSVAALDAHKANAADPKRNDTVYIGPGGVMSKSSLPAEQRYTASVLRSIWLNRTPVGDSRKTWTHDDLAGVA